MHGLEHEMPLLVHLFHPLRGRTSPRQIHNTPCAPLSYDIDHLLRELLPPLVLVAVGLVRLDGQTSIEEQDSSVRPRREQTAVLGWGLEVWVVLSKRDIDVLEGWWRGCRRPNGEAETVGLVQVVVRILAEDDRFDGT